MLLRIANSHLRFPRREVPGFHLHPAKANSSDENQAPQETAKSDASLQEQISKLQQQISTLKGIKQQQRVQNKALSNAQRQGASLTREKRQDLNDEQAKILQASQALQRQLQGKQLASAQQGLSQANSNMQNSSQALKQENAELAHDEGQRAYEALRSSELALNNALYDLADQAMQALQQQAQAARDDRPAAADS